jgi:hypothetical protein
MAVAEPLSGSAVAAMAWADMAADAANAAAESAAASASAAADASQSAAAEVNLLCRSDDGKGDISVLIDSDLKKVVGLDGAGGAVETQDFDGLYIRAVSKFMLGGEVEQVNIFIERTTGRFLYSWIILDKKKIKWPTVREHIEGVCSQVERKF